MVNFNDYSYSENPSTKIDKLAARIDANESKGGNNNGKIDTSSEKSIFLDGAKNLVKQNKLDAAKFKSIFGAEFKEDLKYDGAPASGGSDGAGSSGTPTPEISDSNDSSSGSSTTDAASYDISELSDEDRKSLVEYGEDDGDKLYNALNGTNVLAVLNGFDLGGVFGDDGHEAASDLITTLDEATPLEIAALVRKFNTLSKADNQEKICKFMINEVWDNEEKAVKLIAEKTLEMCEQLKAKKKWEYNPVVDRGFKYLEKIKESPSIIDDEYDDNELIMDRIDYFVARISELYMKEFGPVQEQQNR